VQASLALDHQHARQCGCICLLGRSGRRVIKLAKVCCVSEAMKMESENPGAISGTRQGGERSKGDRVNPGEILMRNVNNSSLKATSCKLQALGSLLTGSQS